MTCTLFLRQKWTQTNRVGEHDASTRTWSVYAGITAIFEKDVNILMAVLERFCRYASQNTQSCEESSTYPSTLTQIEFNRGLKIELEQIGCQDVVLDEYGVLTATIPANRPNVPVMAWLAHVDTSPETSGQGVKPQIYHNYQGQDLPYAGLPGKVLSPQEFPELKEAIGRTVITSDGSTLLGTDCKAGLTAIVEAAEHLLKHPELPHGEIRIVSSVDEEIGAGTLHMGPERVKAQVAYTLDGGALDMIDCETFSADLATITITGINTHPSYGKGRMVNAIRIASDFICRLPQTVLSPETSEKREGFLHPYDLKGGVDKAEIKIILRNFETETLPEYKALLENIAASLRPEYPKAVIEVEVHRQYRNLRDGLAKEPRALLYAIESLRRLGRNPRKTIIRGGTDGSALTEMGLPTPNLSSGQHNIHSPYEWTTVEEMEITVQWLLELAKIWVENPDPASIADAPLDLG